MGSSAEQRNGMQRQIRIAELQPALETHHTSITGTVILIWPYSSSRKTFSLLLAEPDFRLRRHRGQVRIHFTGSSATAAARTGVSIGAQIRLSLEGVQWAKDESRPRAPGQGVEWELQFGERLVLQIESEPEGPFTLDIDHPNPSPTAQTLSPTPPQTPSSSSVFAFSKSYLGIGNEPETWSSPAFLKRSRLSSSHSNVEYDPFRDDNFEEDKRRKRTKFGRESGQWRFADRTPSPEKEYHVTVAPADVQTAVATGGEVGVIAAMSPESLKSIQERPSKVTQVEETRDVDPGISSEKAGEDITLVEGIEGAGIDFLQVSPEMPIEPASKVLSHYANGLEGNYIDTGRDDATAVVSLATFEAHTPPAPTPPGFDADELKDGLTDALEEAAREEAARAMPEAQLERISTPSSPFPLELEAGHANASSSRSLVEEEIQYHECPEEETISSDEDELEAELEGELTDTEGSGSSIEGATERQEDLQRSASIYDEDEQMALDPSEDQPISRTSRSSSISEASVIIISESSSGDKDVAAPSAVLQQTQEPFESEESSEVFSVRGSSVESEVSDEGQPELETDEELNTGESDLPMDSYGGLDFAVGTNRTDSETEDGLPLDDEAYHEPVLERSGNSLAPAVGTESQNELSDFGLDGSVLSQNRSGLNHASLSNKTTESHHSPSDSAVQIESNNELVFPSQINEEGLEVAAEEDTNTAKNDSLGAEISPTGEIVEESIETNIEQAVVESERADVSNHMEYTVTSLHQSSRQVFDAEPRSHEGSDSDSRENESSIQGDVKESAQELVNDAPVPPHLAAAAPNREEFQNGEKEELTGTEEDFSKKVVEMQDLGEAMETLPDIPPKMSTVEIIDLESEDGEVYVPGDDQLKAGLEPTLPSDQMLPEDDEEDEEEGTFSESQAQGDEPTRPGSVWGGNEEVHAPEAIYPPAETEPTLQDLEPIFTRNIDQGLSTAKGEEYDTNVPLRAQGKPLLMENSHFEDIEPPRPREQFLEGKGSPTSIRSAKIVSKAKEEVLESSDTEFPDILDLFAASRKPITADGTAVVVEQTSQEKAIFLQHIKDDVQPGNKVSIKEQTADGPTEDFQDEKDEETSAHDRKSETKLLTPNATQKTQLLSQEPLSSLQSLVQDGSLPTPRLTQSVSATVLDPNTPKRRSFVERLREKRSLSAKSLNRKSTDAASPWFAPNTSGKVIPNTDSESVESQDSNNRISSGDEDHPKHKPSPASVRQSPRLHRTLPLDPPPSAPQPPAIQQPGFRTTYSYFTPLSTLSSHFGNPTDVLATIISSTTITRAKTGPKDFYQSLYITDPSSASSQPPFTMARIFRPHESAFPEAQGGDAILLRNFKVQTQAKQLMLLSTDSSAWAVFRKGEEAQMKGPPVEFAAEERGFARGLWAWYDSLPLDVRITLGRAVRKETHMGKTKEVERGKGRTTSSPRSTRATARHELRDGTTYVDGVSEEEDHDGGRSKSARVTASPSTKKTRAAARYALRLGTASADESTEENALNENGSGGVTPKARSSTTPRPTPTPRTTRSSACDEPTDANEPAEVEDSFHGKGRSRARSTVMPGPRRSTTPTRTSTPRKTRAAVRHELRDGSSYTDGKAGGKYGTHELRDGTKWRDGEGA